MNSSRVPISFRGPLAAAFALLSLSLELCAGEPAVRSGDRIAFLGDSITQLGDWSDGYVKMVMAGLEANGIAAVKIPAGISGHKATQMSARLERDVLAKNPQIMTLSCGVNDVWHGKNGVPLEKYKELIAGIVDRAQAKGIRVYILTATMIGEDETNENNRKLAAYNDFLRVLAKEKGCGLVDLNAEMQRQVAACREKYPKMKGNFLTVDGVHMHPRGNMMMATGILEAFGLSGEQIAKGRERWLEMVYPRWGGGKITVGDFLQAEEKAFPLGLSVLDYYMRLVREDLVPATIAIKNGERVAFLGDGNVRHGMSPVGFVALAEAGLEANGVRFERIDAGGGNADSARLLERLDKDVLPKRPSVLVVSGGVDDFYRARGGVTNLAPAGYGANVAKIVEKAQATGAKVYLLTQCAIGEDPDSKENKGLAAYNEALRAIAKEKGCVLVDMNAVFWKELAALKAAYPEAPGNLLTMDGVRMDPRGGVVLAKELLRAFGCSGKEIAVAEATWQGRRFNWFGCWYVLRDYLGATEKSFAAGTDLWSYVKGLAVAAEKTAE